MLHTRLLLVAVLALAVAATSACTEDSTSESLGEGQRRTELIGVDGGTLRSADGLIFVEVPPRAVSVSTLFSIEPVTDAPGGAASPAYEISPSGRTFERSLELVFDARRLDAGASLDTLRVAVAENGRWVRQPRPQVDAAAGTIAVETPHLSTWALVVATCQSDAECVTGESCEAGHCAVNSCSADTDCTEGVCADGQCGPVPPCEQDAECAAGLSCVAGVCQDEPGCQSDAECAADEICQAGLCQRSLSGCTSDMDCAIDQVCQAGQCVADSPSTCLESSDCPAGEVCGPSGDCLCDGNAQRCDGVCVDTTQDAAHCGGCGQPCASGKCDDGVCSSGSTPCQGDDDCPAGQLCDPESATCTDSACGPNDNLVRCGNSCVDVQTDPSNCGGCGQSCPAGSSCVAAMCTGAGCQEDGDCPPGEVCDAAQGMCIADPDAPCTADSDCGMNGTCDLDTGTCQLTCTTDDVCPAGERCLDGVCGVECVDDSDCSGIFPSCNNGVCQGL